MRRVAEVRSVPDRFGEPVAPPRAEEVGQRGRRLRAEKLPHRILLDSDRRLVLPLFGEEYPAREHLLGRIFSVSGLPADFDRKVAGE